MKVLITGAAGFTGRYLSKLLLSSGYEVHGLESSSHRVSKDDKIHWHTADLTDLVALNAVVQRIRPDKIAHLAAIAFVAHGDIEAIYRTNIIGTRNLLEAVSKLEAPLSSVLLASSANVYGNTSAGSLSELTTVAPANDYAVSKLAMEYMAKLYSDRLPITTVRPFNYTGVGQSFNFLLPKIVDHIKRKAPFIELGNLEVARDFSDVRVVTQCYQKLLEASNVSGEVFNVCSGRAYTLQEVLNMARQISSHDFEVRVNPAFVRANEVKILVGNKDKLDKAIGKVEEFSLEETLRWMFEAEEA
jgi:GDP-6-deoxy-D-talose 4-dehydrogenase